MVGKKTDYRQQQQQVQHQHRHSNRHSLQASLGCIFDNPVAFEDSSFQRKKIDCGNFVSSDSRIDKLECQIRSPDAWNESRRLEKMRDLIPDRIAARKQRSGSRDFDYDSASSGIYSQPCRRKLCLDDFATTPTAVLLTGPSDSTSSGTSVTPLLDDCEIYSDISSLVDDNTGMSLRSQSSRHHEQNISGCCTPVPEVRATPACSPVSDEELASLRSLNDLGSLCQENQCGIELERMTDCFSRAGSFHSLKTSGKDGSYFIYPGWSIWSREHSYRSLPPDASPLANPSTKGFSGVKSLRTSLYQHLVAAAGQHYSVNRSSSTRTILSSNSTRSMVDERCTCGKTAVEEAKVPLLKSLKSTVRKRRSWVSVTYFRKGLRSLASKVFSHDGLNIRSVIPVQRFEQSLLFRHKKLLPEKKKKCLPPGKSSTPKLQDQPSKPTTTNLTGFLQCILRHGNVSYSFWMDEADEVLVAKPEAGRRDKSISFYTCKSKDQKEKSGWRQWQKIRRRMVNLVGTMNLSCFVFTEVDCKGEATHYMDSEFSLFDERLQQRKQQFHSAASNLQKNLRFVKATGSSYLKALWRNTWEGNGSEAGGAIKIKKELGAIVIRVPLEVRKEAEARTSNVVEEVSRTSSWSSSMLGSGDDRVHVILPTGDHGHPSCGLEGPRPLAERWRSGGVCDCGSWDLGCGMITLSKLGKQQQHQDVNSNKQTLNLALEGSMQKVVAMSLTPYEEGLYCLSFQKPMLALQAFATAVAILHSKLNNTRQFSAFSQENQTKLPVSVIGRSCHPNPPLSPVERL